jgi:hypothetical protein
LSKNGRGGEEKGTDENYGKGKNLSEFGMEKGEKNFFHRDLLWMIIA